MSRKKHTGHQRLCPGHILLGFEQAMLAASLGSRLASLTYSRLAVPWPGRSSDPEGHVPHLC